VITVTRMDPQELRDMSEQELTNQMNDLQKELVKQRGQIEVGGFAESPGEIDDMRKNIARIKTVLNEKDNS